MEVARDAPHLFDLSPHKASGLHQGLAFLPKNVCSVREVEFARAYRITETTIEPIAFTVPRVKSAYFQDDIFPPTKVLWEPTLSAEEWLRGSLKQAPLLDLRPEDMRPLSEANSRPASTTSNRASREKENDPPGSAAAATMGPPKPPRQLHPQPDMKHSFNVSVATGDGDWSD